MFQNKEKKELNTEELKKPASEEPASPTKRGLLNEIEQQLEECQKLRDEYLTGWKRERANFLNYKRDETERISELVKFANEGLILKILYILDNIYIAEEKLSPNLKKNQWVRGILRIKTQVLDFLKNQGVEEIKCLGEKFNPNFQEIVEETKKLCFEPGIVVEEIKRGYLLRGKVIRAARVKISK